MTITLFVIFVLYFVNHIQSVHQNGHIVMEWSHINFTWQSREQYQKAVKDGKYIPENIVPTGMKLYKGIWYISNVKWRKTGTPATLAYIDKKSRVNNLLVPYPNWEMNDERSCSNLQSVLAFEIDAHGVMWVLDGDRTALQNCPAKLVLLDINNKGAVLGSYIFPNEVCRQMGGGLTNIVVDDSSDGVYAYIADGSQEDLGIIVLNIKQNRAWKLRDATMFGELGTPPYKVKDLLVDNLLPINGLALSPPPANKSEGRTVYFSHLTGYNLYSINTKILKNEELYKTGEWRREIKLVGKTEGTSDGIMMDNKGILYYTLLQQYGLGKWNSAKPLNSSEIFYTNKATMIWPETFTFDQKGNLYVLSDNAIAYFNVKVQLKYTPEIKFRIASFYTGTNSYLYD